MLTRSHPSVAGNDMNQFHVSCLENPVQAVISSVLAFPIET